LNAGRFALTSMALATACLWGLDARALGLGRVNVQSALGEPLRAEIDVTSISSEEASTLALRVASPDSYRAAGVEYNAVLPGTQVQLLRRSGGQPYLKLTSNRAVVEPFVDVILEMNWASGRLVREYTMLFDPPTMARNTAPAPEAAPRVAPAISAAPQAPAAPRSAVAAPPPPAARPAAPVRSAEAGTGRVQPPAVDKPAAAAATAKAGPSEYRVRSGDTLSGIAERTLQPSVSLDQMLVALFRGNPDAFMGKNMNRLKAGAVLAIPDAQTAQQTASTAAREVIRAQSADYEAYRQQLASGARTTRTDAPARQAKGNVETVIQDNKQAVATPPDKLTLSQGSMQASAAEAAVSKETEKQAAAARVAELSRNVEELKRLQGEASGSNAAASAPAAARAHEPLASAAAAVAAAPSSPVVVAAAPDAMTAAPPATATASAPKMKSPAPVPAPPEPGVMDSLVDNPLLLPGAGLLVVLLLGFGAYRLRGRLRKNSGETSFLESRLQPDSFFGASGGQRIDTHDAPGTVSSVASSSMSYSLSQLDAIGDVDPVAEADVYLAYGRDLQAEEILKEAMRADPDRLAIRSKLLEVYAKRRDTKGFELLAGQLFALSDGQGEEWAKAQELGRQIDPENPLYVPGGQPDLIVREGGRLVEPLDATTLPQSVMPKKAAGPITEAEPLISDSTLDLNLDFDLSKPGGLDSRSGPLEATRPFTTDAAVAPDAGFSLDVPVPPAAASAVDSRSAPLDFDLGDLGSPASPEAPAQAESTSPAPLGADEEFAASMPSFEISDFDGDPLSRKLELAEEFRQIGDTEGARDLLEEVLASADGALKAKARGMLDSLS